MSGAYDRTGSKCSGKEQRGTDALRDAAMAAHPRLRNGGIYNCRPTRTRGSTSLSTHGEGRAWDAMTTVKTVGDALVNDLIEHHHALGVQEVIWWKRRWTTEDHLWHPYDGDSPHKDHVHVAQNRAASRNLTRAQANKVFAATPPNPTEPPEPLEDDDMAVLVQVEDGPKAQSWYLLAGGRRRHVKDDPTLAELRNKWPDGTRKVVDGGRVSLRFLDSAYPPLEQGRDD